MRSVVVTGASGFIGGRLIARLPEMQIWALSRQRPIGAGANVTWIPTDLAEGDLPTSLPNQIDAVIHLAQSTRYREFPEAAREIWDVAVTGTQRLFDYALRAGARHFVLGSTGGLYRHGPDPSREDQPADEEGGNLAFYFTAKRAAEDLARQYTASLNVATLRFFFVYGGGQRETMLMPRLVRSVIEGRPLTLQGQEGMRLNPVHVDDAVKAVAAALSLDCSTVINIAGPDVLSMRSIGDRIGTLVGRSPVYTTENTAPRDLIADISRMRSMLGDPENTMDRGLAELIGSLNIR